MLPAIDQSDQSNQSVFFFNLHNCNFKTKNIELTEACLGPCRTTLWSLLQEK